MLELAAALLVTASGAPDMVFFNANIYTVDPDVPRAEAFALEDGVFVRIGSDTEVLALAGPGTRRFDMGGFTIVPGLIDAHGHMLGLGQLETGVIDLSGTRSYDDVIGLVRARAETTPAGEWIIGRGWDHESWPERELPHHDRLSEALPDHPVWLDRVDGHAGLANEAAMVKAQLSEGAPNPDGGEIIRDPAGRPTGVFIDTAEALVRHAIPDSAMGRPRDMMLAAQQRCVAVGLTGVHDMGIDPSVIELYRELDRSRELKLRIYGVVGANHAMPWFLNNEPFGTERFSVRACKLYMDGAMGSRGAWLLEPYEDRPTDDAGEAYTGLAVSDPGFVEAVAKDAAAKGYQVCTHAIGDRANREVLDIYERAIGGRDDHRFRVEHAQLLSASDIPRFAELGVIASMQATHCTSDMRWVEARVGQERAGGAYAWASLLRTGATIAGGSDFPVEGENPLLGFYASVTRQNAQGSPPRGWRPEERMTRDEALRSMTLDAAYAGFMEDEVGSISIGKRADFVVLTTDIMTCDPDHILTAGVLSTWIDAEQVYVDPWLPE